MKEYYNINNIKNNSYDIKIEKRNEGFKQGIINRLVETRLSKDLLTILENIDKLSFNTKVFELSTNKNKIRFYFNYEYCNYQYMLSKITNKSVRSYDKYYIVEVPVYDGN